MVKSAGAVCMFPNSLCSCSPPEKDRPRHTWIEVEVCEVWFNPFSTCSFPSIFQMFVCAIAYQVSFHVLMMGLLSHGKWECWDARAGLKTGLGTSCRNAMWHTEGSSPVVRRRCQRAASSNPVPFPPSADWRSHPASPELCSIESITQLPSRAGCWLGNSSHLPSSSLPFVLNESSKVHRSCSLLSLIFILFFFIPFPAESCFFFAFTRQKLPPFCQQGYVGMQGLLGSEGLRRHAVEAGLLEDYTPRDFSGDKTPDSREGSQDQLLRDHVIPVRPLQHLVNAKDEL